MTARGFFITGTDTEIGKTWVTTTLMRGAATAGIRICGMKPVAAGTTPTADGLVNDDVRQLTRLGTVAVAADDLNPYCFNDAISPHLAARRAGVTISLDRISEAFTRLSEAAEVVLVEGAGGWYAPINDTATMADLAQQLSLPVVLVVGMRLGCLNHARLTEEAILSRGLRLSGWVANEVVPDMEAFADNLATLQASLRTPLLMTLRYGQSDHPWPLLLETS